MSRLSRLYTSLSNVLIVLAIVCAPLVARATTVATPTFSPAAGTYTSAQSVKITDSTSGATIYYTLGTTGSTPTTSSTKYTAGATITVSTTETLEAIATASGDTNSSVATAVYTLQAPTPTFSLAAGTYGSSQTVTISDANSAATIYYTLGATGSTPTTSSTKYTAGTAITVNSTETLEAIAVVTGYSNSTPASATYTFVAPTPTFSLATGTYGSSQTVTISDANSAATIYYTLGATGSTPTTSSTKYTAGTAITVNSTETLEAIAVVTGYSNSTPASATYTITTAPGTLMVYLSAPGAGGESTSVPGALTETFDALATGKHTSAYVSTAGIGTYGSSSQTFAIEPPTAPYLEYGGATDSTHTTPTNYFAVGSDSSSTAPVYLTLTKPVSYFGFWWSAGDTNNRVALYSGSTLYGTFSTASLLSLLNNGTGTITANNGTAYETSAYFGNPNIASGANDSAEPFAYVSFVITGATIDTIAFYNASTGTSFESDNHSAIFAGNTVTIPATFALVETLSLSSQAVPPIFSPAAGTYATPQTVTISSSTPGASIIYTTDGTKPSLTNGITCANPNPCSVPVAASETLQAIAYETGMTTSNVASAAYTIPVSVTVSPASATVYASGTQQFTDVVTGSTNSAVKWTISPATGAGSVSASGLYTAPATITSQQTVIITATSQADTTKSASAPVLLMPPVAVNSVTPESVTLSNGSQTQQFSASVTNATNTAVTWTVSPPIYQAGTINSAGLYTAPASFDIPNQVVTITATSQVDSTKSAFSTVILTPSVSVGITPSSATLYGGQTQSFSATVGNASNKGVTWTISPSGAGTINGPGLYAAPVSVAAQQTVTVTATSLQDTTKSASATITLMPSVAVSMNPPSATLLGGQTKQLTASVTNTSNTAVTWSLTPATGSGALSATGLYTAPATIASQQTVVVTATSVADSTKSSSAMITLSPAQCASSGYGYQRAIVIDHGQVPNTDQTNFPFLFNTQDPAFATTANGGHVTNSNGYDIIFSTDPHGLTKLDHEMEEYNPANGQVIAWVRIPTLSHTTDTVLYVFYGNSSITAPQQNPTGVWDANFMGVWHVANGSVLSLADSTRNGNNATNNGATATTGQIDGGMQTNGSTYATIGTPSSLANLAQGSSTFSAWVNTGSWANGVIMGKDSASSSGGWALSLFYSSPTFTIPGSNIVLQSPTQLGAGVWSYVTVTLEGSATQGGQATIYVNGLPSGTGVAAANGAITADGSSDIAYLANAASVGCESLYGCESYTVAPLNGSSDEFRISNAIRSADWIAAEYNNQNTPSGFYTLYPENAEEVLPAAPTLYPSDIQQFAVSGQGACSSATVNWTLSSSSLGSINGSGLFTAPASIAIQQTGTITATSQAGATLGSATVTLMPPMSMSVTPASATFFPSNSGSTQQFSASVANSSNTAVTWTISPAGVGTIDQTGLYTVPSFDYQQTVTVTATSQADQSQSASATVNLMLPVSVSITPSFGGSASSYSQPYITELYFDYQTLQFSASVANTSNTAVTWTISPVGMGTINGTGLYTAPPGILSPQTVSIIATSQADPTASATATVTLMPEDAVSVSPSRATLLGGQTQQFGATVGDVINGANTALTWTISPAGAGTISASGLYTAPASVSKQQTVIVTATNTDYSSGYLTTQSASAMIALAPTVCASSGYGYQRAIVISHTQVPNTDQVNFPFLFNTTDPAFKTIANGGHVSSTNGFDIIFSTDPNGLTKLDYELEEYNPASGQIVAWIRIPTLSHTSDTVLYVFYGNSTITASQQNPTGVWDANYQAVYHLANAGSGLATDSTVNANSGTVTSVSAASGEIDGAASFDGASSYIQVPSAAFPINPVQNTGEDNLFTGTFGVWFKTSSYGVILGQTPSSDEPGPNTDSGGAPVLYIDGTGSLVAASFLQDFQANPIVTPAAYNDNKWHFAVETFGDVPGCCWWSGAGTETLYIDGKSMGSLPVGLLSSGVSNPYNYFLGTGETYGYPGSNQSWFYFGGALDEVNISNIARSGDWIATEYNNQSSPSAFYALQAENAEVVIPATVSLYASQSQQFTSSATVQGMCSPAAVTWTLPAGTPGSLSASGLYTAPANISAPQTVTITAGSSAQSALATITLLPPMPVSIAPSSATVLYGQTQQFFASVSNSSNTAVTWTISPVGIGMVDSTGLYTAPTSGKPQTVILTATSQADTTKSASVTVTLMPPVSISLTPSSSGTLHDDQTQQFTAIVSNTSNTAVTWTLSSCSDCGPTNLGGLGTLTSTGLYKAPPGITTGQSVYVTATSQANPAVSASSYVILAPLVTVSVLPASATLNGGQTQQFNASISNSNTVVTWTLSPAGAGTISATGLYTAPASVTTQQTVVITATSQANTALSASAMITLTPAQCASSGYGYQRAITISHAKVPNTDQANFPFLFNTTDSAFKTIANGGHVTNSNGYDIIFSIDPDGFTKLDYELEEYNPATGQVVAWVRIPTLSHSSDTVLYVFYGNPSVTAPQQNPTGVWDSNYMGVWHVANNGSQLSLADSTSNGNNATNNGATATTGQIDGGMQTNGSTYATIGTPANLANLSQGNATFSAWVNMASGAAGTIVGKDSYCSGWDLYVDSTSHVNFTLKVCGGETALKLTSLGTISNNTWSYVTVTTSGDSIPYYANYLSEATIYINGSPSGSGIGAFLDYDQDSAETAYLANAGYGSGPLNGSSDEFRISNVIRSADWIATEYNNQILPSAFYTLAPESAEAISPPAVSLNSAQSQQFTVSITGMCSSAPVVWSMPSGMPGTLTASGLYIAPNSITSQLAVPITATTLGASTTAISATVTLTPPVSVKVAPDNVTLNGGQTQQFTTGNTPVTWTILGAGTISSAGLYTAPSSVTAQQTVIVTATSQADSVQSASVTITLAAPAFLAPESGSVSPVNAALYAGQTQQFTATANDNTNPSVMWTISPAGVGNLSAFGLYTAPTTVSTQQTLTITATDQVNGTQLVSATVTILPTPCGSSGYNYVRTIVIDHTKVPNTDQINFPFLVNTTDPMFATTANGGHVINPNGYDLVFTSDPAGQNKLNYEIEQYNPTDGQVVAWVRIPTLLHTADTVLYVFYGNPNITASQQNPAGVWDSNFTAVYHLQTTSSGTSVADSTTNGNSGIAGNDGIALPINGTGVFGTGAGSFNGSQGIYLPPFSISTFTASAWVFSTASGQAGAFFAGPPGAMEARVRNDNTLDLVEEDVVDMGASSSLLTIDAWNHVAISYDGSTARFYINGVPSGATSVSAAFGSGNYYIGEAGNGENFIGNIDELHLSGSVRSADWTATEYNNQSSPSSFYSVSTENENAFAISPPIAGLYASQSKQFAVAGVCNTAATWTMPEGAPGNLTSGGLYTAPASIAAQQTVTITATSSGVPSNSATASVTLMPPVAVSVTPANTTLTDNQTEQLTAIVANSFNQGVTWTLNQGAAGTISAAGLYSAPSSIPVAQTVTITATSQEDSTKSASATITLSSTQCALNQYGYQRVVVIDHTKVPNTDQTNFPFLFNTTDQAAFATTANGGQVTSPNGYDIIFSTDQNGLTKLDHELEEYNPVTGQVVAWVRIPTLSHTTDTVLYVFYGNPNIVSSQQNPAGVWDSNYQAVYHLANIGTGPGSAFDSTAYGNNGSLTSILPASGDIYTSVGGAAGFNGTSSVIQIPQADFPSYPTATSWFGTPTSGQGPFTASFGLWFKTASAGGLLSQSPDPDCDYTWFSCSPDKNPEPGDFDPPQNPLLYLDDNGRIEVNGGNFVSPAAYNDNNWHFAVMTYASSGVATLYVDGKSVVSEQQASQPAYSPNYVYYVGTTYTFLSDLGNSNWLYFNGNIDEVTVSSIPRSGDWVQTEFNNQSSPSTFYIFNPASTAQVAPSAISLYAAQSQQFVAANSCNSSVSWSMPAGTLGGLTSSGLYTAPDSIATQQSFTITATNPSTGTTIGSSVVTLLPPPLPITLSAAAQSPYTTGSSQNFTATLKDQLGDAEAGVAVTFIVNGANSNLGSATTDSNGVASYTYSGANTGSDSILATAVINGQQLTSNAVTASWINPVPVNPGGSVALIAPSTLGQGGLVGAFTDNNGDVIEPVSIGAASREFLVPAGATQLQLGVDDNHYADNGGSGFVVDVVVNGVPLTAPVSVPATAMPWNWVNVQGGLNYNYQYAMNDGTGPVVAATGLTQNETISIAYQSGTVSTNFPTSPLVNAAGDQAWITGTTLWQGAYFPTLYTTTSAYPVGQPITFNALVANSSGAPMPNVPVTLNVTGTNMQQLQATTDSTGTATFLYSGSNAGTDNLQAQAFPSGEGSFVSNQTSVTWTNYGPPLKAGTLTFAPNEILGPGNGQVYIMVAKDASEPPKPILDANVGFYVSGANVLSQGGMTDINGQIPFSFNHSPGSYNIVAVDSVGRSVVISNTLSGVWTPPTISNPPGNEITVGISAPSMVTMPNALQLNGTATDSLGNSLTATWSTVSGPGTVTFAPPQQPVTNGSFTATATFREIGSYVLEVTVSDGLGASTPLQFSVTVLPAQHDPQGWIGSPAYGSAVSGVVPIMLAPGVTIQTGGASAPTLTYYPASNPNNFTPLPITAGSDQIASLDTTTLQNGTYWIQLQATDLSGESQYSLVQVTVSGNYKPGRVTATVTDLVVPATGLAINIQRTYDSLNAATSSDFGYGWSLGLNVNLTVDPAGNVTFTLGGQRKTFYLTPQMPGCSALVGCLFPYYYPAYTPEPGLHGTLTDSGSSCTNGLDIIVPNGSLWVCQSGGLYTPTGFVYTDPNGTAYNISAAGNLQSIQDLSGNSLTITASGITSTTGLSVPFVRDSSNRITQITDPAGNIYQYAYDASGNLHSVTYPNTSPNNPVCSGATAPNTSIYNYDSSHRYTGGTDALCHTLPSSAYYPSGAADSNGNSLAGRLQSVTDALGETTSYAYLMATSPTGNSSTTITYPDSTPSNPDTATMVYDSYGDLLTSTDPNNITTTNTYDANHNLISVTVPRDATTAYTTTYTYDANGNKTSSTYPSLGTGHNTTSTVVYNQYSQPISTTDELGHVRTFNYDANYNPQNVTDSIGTLASFVFNQDSTLAAKAIGYDLTANPSMATQYTYDANGNMASSTDPLGRTTSYTYDSLGHKLSMTTPTPTSLTGTAASTTTYEYDALGNLIQISAPLGRTTSAQYDANGNKLYDIDANGNKTSYVYDALNRLIETDYPSSSTTPATKSTRTYDFRNNVIDEIDQAGNDTHHVYDPAGRLLSVTRGYGSATTAPSTTSYTYYEDGRKYTETDPALNVTTYTYDNAGRLIEVANAAGNTQFGYDNAGNQISITDPRGHTTQFQYDARKRLVKTIYPDEVATTEIRAYDGPGNLIQKTDQAGNVIQYTYDAVNELQTVVQKNSPNTSSNTNSYSYDPLGNLASLTDENLHTTQNLFDQYGEPVQKTLPVTTQTETRTYNAAGNLYQLTHFNGVTTTYTYDALNRLLSRATPGETTVSFTYTATGKRATMSDGSGNTTYIYDALNRLTTKAAPAGTLTYSYDGTGNLASISSNHASGVLVSYTWDNQNRLSTVTDNRLQGQQTTTYSYDPASNLTTVTAPNDLKTTLAYDSMDRLTSLTSPVSSYTYTLGATGNRTGVTEGNGRTTNWSYDNIYRLTNETINSDPGGNNGSASYGLDPVGNRLSLTSGLPGLETGSFGYNANDEVSSETYDANGNALTAGGKTFAYDSANRLTSMNGGQVTLVYDGDGNRVAKTVGGVTTQYLVDGLNPTGYPQVVEELVNGAVTRQYAYGLQRISENQVISNVWTPSFYGYDSAAGNVRFLSNAAGAVTDTYEYDAFGNQIYRSGTTPNNFLYRGEQFDTDLGLYYLRARQYNPATGRFMSRDPEDGDPDEPASLHKYLYADGEPVNLADPTGRSAGALTIGPVRVPVEYLMILSIVSIPVAQKSLPPIACDINALLSAGALGVAGDTNIVLDFPGCSATGTAPTVYPLPIPYPISTPAPWGPYGKRGSCDPGDEWHHIVPQAERSWAEGCGIDIDQPGLGMCIKGSCHDQIHGNSNGTNWNAEWSDQINEWHGECPSDQELTSFALSLLIQFADDIMCQ